MVFFEKKEKLNTWVTWILGTLMLLEPDVENRRGSGPIPSGLQFRIQSNALCASVKTIIKEQATISHRRDRRTCLHKLPPTPLYLVIIGSRCYGRSIITSQQRTRENGGRKAGIAAD